MIELKMKGVHLKTKKLQGNSLLYLNTLPFFVVRCFSFLSTQRLNILCNLDSAKKLITTLANIYTPVPGLFQARFCISSLVFLCILIRNAQNSVCTVLSFSFYPYICPENIDMAE